MSKRLFLILLVLAVIFCTVMPVVAQETTKAEGGFSPFGVYYDRGNKGNHYVGSGWMGDYGDIKFSENEKENPYSGKTSIKIVYTAEGKQGANWAGMYWQWPPNNWGEKNGGYNLTGATKLTFWARGEKGGEQIMEFKMGGLTGTYSDTDSASVGPIELTKDWQQYTIDLTDLDVSYISGGFSWVTNSMANPEGCVFFLDDIQYE
ncbi:MAG: hypothetical protein V1747_01045 [Candidatus Omnitrophota bacterium]